MKKYQQGRFSPHTIWAFTKPYRILFAASQLVLTTSLEAASTHSFYDWTGYYFGIKTGAAFSHFDVNTTTQAGSLFTAGQATLVNNAGKQSINTAGFLSGIEGGYNWQFNRFLLGLETDIQSLSTSGLTYANTRYTPTHQFVLTSYADNNWLFTLRPRLGLITNNWLLYATSGLSLAFLRNDFLFSTNLGVFESQKMHRLKPGYNVGAGIETSLTPHVSLKAEYLFEDFNATNASLMRPANVPEQSFTNNASMHANLISLGINYHMDDKLPNPLLTSTAFDAHQWRAQLGARLFFSSGLAGTPQPLLDSTSIGDILASRLIFSEMAGTSEEVFARVDHASGVFAKGYIGAGSVGNGQLNDEDFPAENAYSNTFSNAWGNLSYATIDLGYAFLKNLFGTTGAFIGYNYYAQNFNIYNCTQIAGDSVCVPSTSLANFLALSEDDQFNSLRVGLTSEFNITDKFTLSSEVAYLPTVNFHGLDMHNARALVGPEEASSGDGAMLEAILNYQLNDSWSMGLGGRYWTWNMHNGSLLFDFLGDTDLMQESARFNAERYGVFLQVNYHTKQPNEVQKEVIPVNWQGLFIGGSLGGSWSKSYWSDPFGPTPAAPGYINVAGFGDELRTTGPLGGLDVHMNWHTGRLVYGVGGSISGADIRGQNTLFSGIGGVNGQERINYIGSIVGRLGTTVDRSLLYLNAGGAVVNTQYSILGNTGILTLGLGSQTLSTWGWTGGVGVEYALSDSWNTNIEYDYINIPNHSLSFPSVALINTQYISEHRNMSLFKVGVNYKFNTFNS